MYSICLINPIKQYQTVCWSLVFKDSSKRLPDIWVDKKYPDTITHIEICADVKLTLETALFEQTRPPQPRNENDEIIEFDEDGNFIPREPGIVVDLTGEIITVDDTEGINYQWQL